jgi:hypothetical protein
VRYQPAANVLRTALFTGDIEREQGQRLVTQFGAALKSDIVKVPHHGSDNLFPAFPTTVDADFVFVSSSGTNKTFMHPRKSALDLYDTATPNARIFCTCDAAGKTLTFFAIVSSTGAITVSPVAKPFFAWTPVNGVLRKRTFTPGP